MEILALGVLIQLTGLFVLLSLYLERGVRVCTFLSMTTTKTKTPIDIIHNKHYDNEYALQNG